MRRLLPIATSGIIISLAVLPVFAQERKNSLDILRQRNQELTQRFEDRKASISGRLDNRNEMIASREAVFKAFRNQKKAEIAKRIEANLDKVNQNRTAEMSKHLEILNSIYTKLATRASDPKFATSSALQDSLASAKTAIASAQAAVIAQQAKTYTISNSTESTVKATAQTAITALKTDLKATFQTVISAKDALRGVIKILNSLRGAK